MITDNDVAVYKEVVRDLAVWCQDKNLFLNVSKTKELIVDNRILLMVQLFEQAPITINRAHYHQQG